MYPIVACDLDGTLLSPEHRLTSRTRQMLSQITSKGIHFVFATGRHHIDVAQMRDSLNINAFMITSNGARVHNTKGELIFSQNLDRDIAMDLMVLKHDDPAILTNIYRDDDWFTNRDIPEERRYFQESHFEYQLLDPDRLPGSGISKIFFVSDEHEKLLPLEQAIVARWGDRVNVSFSLPGCLEIMAGGVSKGHALEAVAKLLGHSIQECIAFGDGMNDKEMLSMVGKGCIMHNAAQRLKHLLPELEIIGSNRDEAVTDYLNKLFLASSDKSLI